MRQRLPLLRPVLVLGVSLIVTALCLLIFVRIDRVVVAHGHLAGGTAAVYAPWGGRIERVFVTPGDHVKAGGPLLCMESDPLQAEETRVEARIENLTGRIETLKADKARLVTEIHPAEVIQTARDLERARLELNSAEVKYNLTKKLWDMGLTTKLELQDAELSLDLAKVALKDAEEAPALLETRHGATIEQIEAEIRNLTGQIAEEGATLNETKRMLSLDTLTAGADGVVLGEELFELEGRTVTMGDELLRVSTGVSDRFEGTIFDSGRASSRPGYEVKIRLDGYPWMIHGTLPGRLDFVADRRDETGGFPVKVSFDPTDAPGPLFDGMKGQARIVVEEKVSLGRLLLEKLVGKKEP